ncbi:MAG: hypothetical protein ACRDYA_23965 [Egibacteraceae bacterium]
MTAVLPVIGPAVVGSGQSLAWTPCHRQPVRLQAGEMGDGPAAAQCRKCPRSWEVAFKKVGVDWLALWWPA